MGRTFNVTGTCRPDRHYMVDLRDRVTKIRKMVTVFFHQQGKAVWEDYHAARFGRRITR